MQLPTKYKTILALIIKIAENGNHYDGDLTDEEKLQVGALIAGIQNDLGEMNENILAKLGLFYDGSA